MAARYYYFVASLPSLRLGDDVPQASAAFREYCADMLSAEDASLLDYCTLDAGLSGGAALPQTESGFVNGWLARERALRLSLAEARAAKTGWTLPPEAQREAASAGADIGKAALALDNPLEAETLLDGERWEAIEDLVGTDYFSVNSVYAHFLRLQLMERRSLFKAEEGFSQYRSLYDGIVGEAGNV